MCPCVLLDKLKKVFGKKNKKESKESSQSSNSALTPQEVTEKKKEKSKKSRKSEKSEEKSRKKSEKRSKKKSLKSPDNGPEHKSSERQNENSDTKTEDDLNPENKHFVGQPKPKQNPKDFVKNILQSERPDLVGPDAQLTEQELTALDNVLKRAGPLRKGFKINLGTLVDCDSSAQVGVGNDLTVAMIYAYGRFSSIYVVKRDGNSEDQRTGISRIMCLKTSLRPNTLSRMQHETSILRHIFDNTEDAKKKKLGIPTRIPKLHAYGTAGGTPYILMQMKDGNLEKLREECEEERLRKNEKTKEKKSKEDGEKVQLIPPIDAFFIGQEAVIAMKECHSYSIVHRDIKPTNLILGVDDEKAWYLCDFGDACPIGDTKLLSPPDAFTLPYLSRTAHLAVRKPTKATISMDIESWFYVFIELFTELPWKGELDEESVLSAKKSFWESLGSERNLLSELPSEVMKISKIVANTSLENPYSALTAILRDGFKKENAKHSPWKPFWKEERPKTEAKPSAEEQKESVAVENKNKNSKANRSVSKG